MPKTAHLKMIDIWILLCYFGAFFCLTEYAYVLYLTKTMKSNIVQVRSKNEVKTEDTIEKAMKIEKISRIIITCYSLAFPVLFFLACLAHRLFFDIYLD